MKKGILFFTVITLIGCFPFGICQANEGKGLAAGLWPSNKTIGTCVDLLPKLTFDAPPVLGEIGKIKICQVADDQVVDTIDLADPYVTNWNPSPALGSTTKLNVIGNVPGATQARIVNYYPVLINENTATIVPHNNKLKYDTAYYILIEPGVLEGTIEGVPFNGITSKDTWQFTTKASAPTGTTLKVNTDGTADFCTIQGAIDAIPVKNTVPYTIEIADGIYAELLYIWDKYNVTFRGQNREQTIIQYDNCEQLNTGTGGGTATPITNSTLPERGGRGIFLVNGSSGLVLDNLTIENTHGPKSQAETICLIGEPSDHYIAKNCKFLSYQDTIQSRSQAWFYNCLIAGDVDFIWGAATTVLFEDCEIMTRRRNSYIVQARTPQPDNKGFVFLNCTLTREGEYYGVVLARSGGKPDYYDNVAFINCKMDEHIMYSGWLRSPAPNPSTASATSGWKEYKSVDLEGNPIDVEDRFEGGSYQLTDVEFETYYKDRQTIFGNWNPMP